MIGRREFLIGAAAAMSTTACARPAQATQIRVFKTPACGCCAAWVKHLQANGFAVRVTDMDDVSPVARKLGVPGPLRSCHTGEIEGYFVEGHVPASDIRKLLAKRPKAAGIAVPGMPVGSPGMEQGSRRDEFSTLLVTKGGGISVFTEHLG